MVKMTMTVGSSSVARSREQGQQRDAFLPRPRRGTIPPPGRSRRRRSAAGRSRRSARVAPAPPRRVRRAMAAAPAAPACDRRAQFGARASGRCRLERVDEAGLAGQRRALGSDRRQGQEIAHRRASSRGSSPARRNEDLPAPEAPRIAMSRGGAAALKPRSRSMASTIGASRPKKMPASSASSGFRPR